MRNRNAALGVNVVAAALATLAGSFAPRADAAERMVLMEGFVVTC